MAMTTIEALHTAARRYCRGRRTAVYGDPAYRTDQRFWGAHRVQLLTAICADVESVLPADFASPAAMCDYLLLAGQTATAPAAVRPFPYRPPKPEGALEDERGRYQTYIAHITSAELADTDPLPFHYRLDSEASKRIWDALDHRWDTNSGRCWYPLTSLKMESLEILAFQEAWFRAVVPDEDLRAALARHGIVQIWELNEFGWVHEIDAALLVPTCTIQMDDYQGEKYWTAGEMDWLIYASHESSITVAGAWLLTAIKEIWPTWHEHVYTGWEYERPSIAT